MAKRVNDIADWEKAWWRFTERCKHIGQDPDVLYPHAAFRDGYLAGLRAARREAASGKANTKKAGK